MSEYQEMGESRPGIDASRPGSDDTAPEQAGAGHSPAEQAVINERKALESGEESPA